MLDTSPAPRNLRRRRSALAAAAFMVAAAVTPMQPSTAAPRDLSSAQGDWAGRWQVSGQNVEGGEFVTFGVLTIEQVTDGSLVLDGPDTACSETDRVFRGSYKYGSGGTIEGCEISSLDHGFYGDYYGNDGYWGQINMEFVPGSPPTWEGYYSPGTTGQHPNQAYLQWRGVKLGEEAVCAATVPDSDGDCIEPVIFVPGFLGSVIACGEDELWVNTPAPNFIDMRLAADGKSNFQDGSECNKKARATGEVVYTGFGEDVYGGMRDFLRSLPGVKSYFFGYDWRKSPGWQKTQTRLGRLVDRAISESGAKQVTLVAHSMGGLVSRWYAGSPAGSGKVARVVTLGTPYWGAPKPWLALSRGLTGPPTDSWWPDLDSFIKDGHLKKFAQNAMGAFFLYPSPAYYEARGGWLTWAPLGEGPLDAEGTLSAIFSFNGNKELAARALEIHTQKLDSYLGGAIDWQMIVGTGVSTLATITERKQAEGGPVYTYDNGDGTVPTISAAQGVTDQAIVHYVCGVEHAALPGNGEVQQMIKEFVMAGGSIPTTHRGGCPPPS